VTRSQRGTSGLLGRGVDAALISVAILVGLPSAANALSRKGATRVALRALKAITPPSRAVFGFKAPLPAGTFVGEAGGPGALPANDQRLTAPTWVFWGDPTCGAFFAHPSFLVLVDAGTGAVTEHNLLWFPGDQRVDRARARFRHYLPSSPVPDRILERVSHPLARSWPDRAGHPIA
jgi:hypothetical protein